MVKSFLLLLLILFQTVTGQDNYSVVFIHIGSEIPNHAEIAFKQVRLFNEKNQVILIANKEAIEKFNPIDKNLNLTFISCESLHKTEQHKKFIRNSTLNKEFRDGFWMCASERFLYLDDFMTQYDSRCVFHLENDTMIYVNLGELLPTFINYYKGIAAIFDNDNRCIPGFIFIRNRKIMSSLATFFADNAHLGFNDMQVIAKYRHEYGDEYIDFLPIIMEEYMAENTLVSKKVGKVEDPIMYRNNIQVFQSIFDGSAFGHYLGGIDPRNGPSMAGYINKYSVIDCSLLPVVWEYDEFGRKIPYATYGGAKYRINNLHIHSKKLSPFCSHSS